MTLEKFYGLYSELITDESELRPRGTEAMQRRAAGYLRPENPDQHDRGLGVVRSLAERYLADRAIDKNAPRQSQVRLTVERIRDLCAELVGSIEDSDVVVRRNLASSSAATEALERLIVDARLIAEEAGNSLEEMTVDRGGRMNIVRRHLGPPQWQLVRDAWVIFESFRPGEATSGTTGDFHKFVSAIHDYATGKAHSAGESFNTPVKLMGRLRREWEEAKDELLTELAGRVGREESPDRAREALAALDAFCNAGEPAAALYISPFRDAGTPAVAPESALRLARIQQAIMTGRERSEV